MNPAVGLRLKAVREIRMFTLAELARRTGISTAALSRYERGRSLPNQLASHQLAEALDVPAACFHQGVVLSKPPEDEVFYRKRSRIPAKVRGRLEWLGAIFREFLQALSNKDLFRLRETRIPELPDLLPQSPEDTAREFRRILGFGVGPIENTVALLEYFGVRVLQLPIVDDPRYHQVVGVDAFSHWHEGQAYVVLNPAKKDPYRSRFDCAHELHHLLADEKLDSDSREQEQRADRFAAELLVPAEAWLDDVRYIRNMTDPRSYLRMKHQWGVSVACLLYRSRHLKVLTENQYRYAMMRYSELGWRRGEPEKAVPPRVHEEPTLLQNCLRRMARANISLESVADDLGYGLSILTEAIGVSSIENLVSFPAQTPESGPARTSVGLADIIHFNRR